MREISRLIQISIRKTANGKGSKVRKRVAEMQEMPIRSRFHFDSFETHSETGQKQKPVIFALRDFEFGAKKRLEALRF